MNLFNFSLLLFFTLIVPGSLLAQWTGAADMGIARNGHTLTLMQDGRLLAHGGFGAGATQSSTEIYTPWTNSWTDVMSSLVPVFEHTMSLLPDGRLFRTGGWDGNTNNWPNTQWYLPESDQWILGPDMRTGRSGHTATSLQDGRILLVGGFNGNENTQVVEIFDPAIDSLLLADSIAVGRSYHSATLLTDGRVLVTGGFSPNFGFQTTSAEIYDPATDEWTTVANMNTGRDYLASIALNDSQVLVTGGRIFVGNNNYEGLISAEIYHLPSDTWSNTSTMPSGQSYHQMFLRENGEVLLVGSTAFSGNQPFGPGQTLVYTPQTDTWTPVPMALDGRFRYASAETKDGQILVTGGFDATAELFGTPRFESIFGETSSYWNIVKTVGAQEGYDSLVVIASAPDSTVDTQRYRPIYLPAHVDSVYGLLREEGGKVWFRSSLSAEYLVMDLGLALGDTFQVAIETAGIEAGAYVVDSVWYVEDQKHLRLNHVTAESTFEFLEGIGSSLGVAFQDSLRFGPADVAYLLCAGQDGAQTYTNEDSLYQGACQLFFLSIRESLPPLLAAVFPNPASDMLTLRVATVFSLDLEFTLLDVTGRSVLHKRISGPETIISVRGLSAGMYIYRVSGQGLADHYGRIMVE